MKSSIRRQTQNLFRRALLPVCRMLLLGLLFIPTALLDAEAEAAQLSFSPSEATVELAPGETKVVSATVALEGAPQAGFSVIFRLSQVGGSFPNQNSSPPVTLQLDSFHNSSQTAIKITAPAECTSGNYTAIYETVVVRANGSVSPGRLAINIGVNATPVCSKTPEFGQITATQEVIHTHNNKEVLVDFSGTVISPEGCTTDKVWYLLKDEYAELDAEGAVQPDVNGNFTISVPMVAFRKGSDKDGRLYLLKFMASNEAGASQSSETKIVVSHDSRDK